jgi:LemA protein
MSGFILFLLLMVGVVVVVLIWLMATYNGLVGAREQYKNLFSQIDVQLKRRYDLIPNLVETAKGYLKHERETLEAVIAARNQAQSALQAVAASPENPEAMQKLLSAEQGLAGVMTRFMAVSERYPDLKGNVQMAQLSEELTSTENRVAFARQAYNDAVTAYNVQRQVFPTIIIANTMGFHAATLFEITAVQEREAPKVSFSASA